MDSLMRKNTKYVALGFVMSILLAMPCTGRVHAAALIAYCDLAVESEAVAGRAIDAADTDQIANEGLAVQAFATPGDAEEAVVNASDETGKPENAVDGAMQKVAYVAAAAKYARGKDAGGTAPDPTAANKQELAGPSAIGGATAALDKVWAQATLARAADHA